MTDLMFLKALKFAVLLSMLAIINCATSSRYRPAKVSSNCILDYPLAAQLERIEGKVAVGVFVSADGRPVTVRVLESSGHAVLDTAAYQFAKTLTFQPAIIDEQATGSWTKLLLQYKLTDVVFEKSKWVQDVRYLQKQIETASEDRKKFEYQRRLYIRYVGLVEYAKKIKNSDLNFTIKSVIQESTADAWQELWPEIVLTFALFDDFIKTYPDSKVAEQATEDLIGMLIEAEGEIRTKALRSRKTALRVNDYISIIETRIKELQPIVPQI